MKLAFVPMRSERCRADDTAPLMLASEKGAPSSSPFAPPLVVALATTGNPRYIK